MWGYSIRKSKKATHICVSKNSSCDFSANDHTYLATLFQNQHQTLCEGVYRFPVEFDIESILTKEGFELDETRAKNVLDFMKEEGRLK